MGNLGIISCSHNNMRWLAVARGAGGAGGDNDFAEHIKIKLDGFAFGGFE